MDCCVYWCSQIAILGPKSGLERPGTDRWLRIRNMYRLRAIFFTASWGCISLKIRSYPYREIRSWTQFESEENDPLIHPILKLTKISSQLILNVTWINAQWQRNDNRLFFSYDIRSYIHLMFVYNKPERTKILHFFHIIFCAPCSLCAIIFSV